MIDVVIVDHSGSGADASALPRIAAVLQRQANEHAAPAWNLEQCMVRVAPSAPPGSRMIGLFADADQPGALGYHDMTAAGVPLAKVFPKLDAQDGANLSTTISHELLEMLVNPYLARAAQASDGKFWTLEICDAVERDEYEIDGVKVSNFVLPSYFEPPSVLGGVRFDYLGLLAAPWTCRPGGYGQWNAGAGWNMIQAGERRAYRRNASGRSARIAGLA